jgi:hypothetical protein
MSQPFTLPSRAVTTGSALATLVSISLVGATLPPAQAQQVPSSASAISSAPSFGPTASVLTAARAKKAKSRVVIGRSSFALDGTNIRRKAGKMVASKSPRKATPRAASGVDVAVARGRVTAVKVHTRSSRVGVWVPKGGYALSGTKKAGSWLRSTARVGARVRFQSAASTPKPSAPTSPVTTVNSGGTSSSAPMALPSKVLAIYHMMWSNSGSPQLRNLPAQTNVVNLAFLQGDPPSLVGWGSQNQASFVADAKALRARGVRIVASVGGGGGYVNIASRERFVAGVMALNAQLPLDGLDWDLEGTAMGAADVVWISKRLKQLRGNNFAITLAPNGSNIDQYRAIAVQLQRANALDMIGQQFYDAVVSKEAARSRIAQLVRAGIPQGKIGIGMMVGSTANYWTVAECVAAVRFIEASYPGLRGGYLWEAGRAGTADWANQMSGLLKR